MYRKLTFLFVASLINFNSFADAVSITVKPSKGIVGTTSVTFHEDGKVTMLVYESAVQIVEKSLEIGAEESAKFKNLAVATLDEYLGTNEFRNINEFAVTFGVSRTENAVTKSISSRRLTIRALEIVREVRKYAPTKDLLNIDGG